MCRRAVATTLLLISVAVTAVKLPEGHENSPGSAPRKKSVGLEPRDFVSEYSLSLKTQMAQMSQLDISALVYSADDPRLNETLLIDLLEKEKIGSILNSPSAVGGFVPPVEWWRATQQRIYELSSTHGNKIPILYGLDSVHGANYVFNATLFPQQIGMAATFDRDLVHTAGKITGRETRYAGVPWAFSPILGIAVQPSWARVYETFGEDPLVATELGVAIIEGLQDIAPNWMGGPNTSSSVPTGSDSYSSSAASSGNGDNNVYPRPDRTNSNTGHASGSSSNTPPANPNSPTIPSVAACMKHFLGYTNVRTGHDRTPVWLPFNILLQHFLPPFQAAADAGVLSVMENYIELNGRPMVASQLILNFILRQVVGFNGMMVTDYNEIYNLKDFHHAVDTYEEAVHMGICGTTIDMAMVGSLDLPHFTDLLSEHIIPGTLPPKYTNDISGQDCLIDDDTIKTAANRVLTLKHKLGLFDGSPVWNPKECAFGCPEHRQAALDTVRASVTLLQNKNNLLPLTYNKVRQSKIAVIGQACDSVPLMAGGWTIHWQGTSNKSAFPYGTTIYQELQRRIGVLNGSSVSFHEGCNVTENSVCGEDHLNDAIQAAVAADYVVMCLGERHYAEKPGDIDDITLPGQQIQMVQKISAAIAAAGHQSTDRVIAVLIEGRPRVLQNIPELVGAVIHGYLPGPSGGQGIVDILVGLYNPSGRLPITYPSSVNNAPLQYWRKYSANTDGDYNPLWPFGHGLQYNQVDYQSLTVEIDQNNGDFIVVVTIQNSEVPTNHTVLLFGALNSRPITPEAQVLLGFRRVELGSEEQLSVNFTFNAKVFYFYDEINCRRLVPGAGRFWSETVSSPFIQPYHIPLTCDLWSDYYSSKEGKAIEIGNNGKGQQTSDFMISSIVCFGAGVVGTFILVQWMMLKRRRQKEKDALISDEGGDHGNVGYEGLGSRDDLSALGPENVALPGDESVRGIKRRAST